MKTVLVLLLPGLALAMVGAAMAQDKDKDHPKVQQVQNQNQSQTVSASSAGQSNSQVSEVRVPRQAPAAIAPDAYPSAPCRAGFGGAASAPVGGVSVGGSKLDQECDKRETARAFAHLGLKGAALKILCTTKAAKRAVLEECDAMQQKHWSEDSSLTFPN